MIQARRRDELASDVPLSTTVLQTQDIGADRIDSLSHAIDVIPNVVFSTQGGPITIRGISSLGPSAGVDRPQSVGVFIDDVYLVRPYGIPTALDDYERIEVVCGPQATLYGMNTLGGAVNLVSPEPADSVKTLLEGGFGSNGLRTLKGSFDAPIVPGSLYVHGLLSHRHSDGYVTNVYNGKKIHAFDLTSITAYRGHDYSFKLDGDFSVAPLFWQQEKQRQRQFSQEFRLTSNTDGPISWMLGSSYLFEDYKAQQYIGLEAMPDVPDRNDFDQTTKMLSAFGQLGWQATDRLNLSAGLRYTHVRKDTISEAFSPLGFNSFGAPARVLRSPSFSNLSPELSASVDLTENAMGFVRVSRGFLAGGMTQFISSTGEPNLYKPETAWTYDAGTKTRWLNDRLELNLTGFYSDIRNLHVVQFTSPTTRLITNAGTSTSYGLELEARAKMTKALRVTAGYGYTHARFDKYIDSMLGMDYAWTDIPFAPRHSANLGFDWRQTVGGGVTLFAGANYGYKSSYLFTPGSVYRRGAVNLVDVRIGVERGPLSVSLYAKNLLDQRYLSGFFESSGIAYGTGAPGRTVGLLAQLRW